jgi:hypothetical protein
MLVYINSWRCVEFYAVAVTRLLLFLNLNNSTVQKINILLLQFSHFFSDFNFFGLSTTDETWLVEMRIWCIKTGIVLILHYKRYQQKSDFQFSWIQRIDQEHLHIVFVIGQAFSQLDVWVSMALSRYIMIQMTHAFFREHSLQLHSYSQSDIV